MSSSKSPRIRPAAAPGAAAADADDAEDHAEDHAEDATFAFIDHHVSVAEEDDAGRLPDGSLVFGHDARLELRRSLQGAEVEPGGPQSLLAVYGRPCTGEEAAARLPPGGGGLVWHAQLVADGWTHPKHTDARESVRCPSFKWPGPPFARRPRRGKLT